MFFEEDGKIVVVDFKSDRVSKASQYARAEEYRPQLETYGRALEKITGKPVKERLIYFFATGDTISV